MPKSRLLSLIVAGIYLLVLLIGYLTGRFDDEPKDEILKGLFGLLGWLALSLACIWYGDEMGGWMGTVHFKGNYLFVPKRSGGF